MRRAALRSLSPGALIIGEPDGTVYKLDEIDSSLSENRVSMTLTNQMTGQQFRPSMPWDTYRMVEEPYAIEIDTQEGKARVALELAHRADVTQRPRRSKSTGR